MAHRRSKGQYGNGAYSGMSQIAREMALLDQHDAEQAQMEFQQAQQQMLQQRPGQSQSGGIQDGTPMSSDDDGDDVEDGEYRSNEVRLQEDENSDDYEVDERRHGGGHEHGHRREDDSYGVAAAERTGMGMAGDEHPGSRLQRSRMEELTVKDLRDAQMKRDKLEAMCSEPYFADFISPSTVTDERGNRRSLPGLFCRIFIGNRNTSRGNSEPVYRVCEMMGVEEYSKPYNLQSTGRKVTIALLIAHGRARRVFQIRQTSNSPFTDKELEQWKATMRKDDLELPTKDDLNEAYLNAIKKHKNFKYDKSQIAIMRERKSKHRDARNLANPHKEKLRVSTLIATMDDTDRRRHQMVLYLNDINREIERRSSQSSQSVKVSIASINEKNKIKNKKLMLKAREKERRSQLLMRGRRREKDPFTRAITAPQIESFNTAVGELDEANKKRDEEERRKKEQSQKAANRAQAEEEEMNTLSLLDVAKQGMRARALDDGARAEGTLITGDDEWASAVHEVAKQFVAQCQDIDIQTGRQRPPPQFGRNTNPSKYGYEYTKRPDALRIITVDEYLEKYKYK